MHQTSIAAVAAAALLCVVGCSVDVSAFQQQVSPLPAKLLSSHDKNVVTSSTTTTLFMGKRRKAKNTRKVEKQSRPQQFFDLMDEVDAGKPKPVTKEKVPDDDEDDNSLPEVTPERQARADEARKRMEERPDVSTMIVDEETGMETVAQGKAVMDVVTRKAVQLSKLGPEYRLAQLFPGVPPDIRDQYRLDWRTVEVPQMVEALKEACSVPLKDGTRGIPPHPSVANKAIDFVLANRDYLGYRMKRTLGRLEMRAMWKGNKSEAKLYGALWKNFLTLENHISAPFRQIIMDAEGRVGPNFGNLDLMSFCDGELYERVANYLVLKGMVAHWEKKVKDADYVEKTPQTRENFLTVLSVGDPKRYLPDPPILFTLRECTQVCLMAQQMTKAFVENEALFGDFPPEIKFLETALTIKGGTPLRKYMMEDFCPSQGITPEGLREGMRRLYQQLDNMQTDPYGDLTNIVERLQDAMAVGSDDERNPYTVYLGNPDPEGPGYFQTYTFNHNKLSLVRFFDAQYERSSSSQAREQASSPMGGFDLFGAFGGGGGDQSQQTTSVFDSMMDGGGGDDVGGIYNVPAVRAAGRPHDLGWLDMFEDEEKDPNMRLGKVPPGQIIMED